MHHHGVSIRSQPYPYKAGLAICNDIDRVRTTDEFLEIQRFLNTKAQTTMGEGIGLEIGNSFYFYDDEREFSYFTHDDRARLVIIDLAKAGFIDCLHSYGDAANEHDQVIRSLDILNENDCRLDVWINHHGARSNLSEKFEYMFVECSGDDPESDIYHLDQTVDYGIRYVWVGATTRMVGQAANRPPSTPLGVFDRSCPWRSSLSVMKEIRKNVKGRLGDQRYGMQGRNALMEPISFRDGRRLHEFGRYCNHPVSVSVGATSRGLSYAISARALDQLQRVQGYMIVYTHLGKNEGCEQVIATSTQAALRTLERAFREGNIYVTTTSRLLNHHRACLYLDWSHRQVNGEDHILIAAIDDPIFGRIRPSRQELQGMTFYVPNRESARLYIGDTEIVNIRRNAADDSGRDSVTVPFVPLEFPL